ncbi:MAG: hypothetical protein IT423_05985 [Pirellulaceae bacterium]|nr:hypothetical protein [Pirellulaceae bacterium]
MANVTKVHLYESEDLKEGSIPAVIPIKQVRDEGNCESRGPANHIGAPVFQRVGRGPTDAG